MYLCKKCGNKKVFIEVNSEETEVVFDEATGKILSTHDAFLGCMEVRCGICNASSEKKEILERELLRPV